MVKSKSSDPEKLVLLYNQTLSTLLDDYAPMTEKLFSDRPDSYWYSSLVRKAKSVRRLAEKRWRKTGLECDKQIFRKERNKFAQVIRHEKSEHIQSLLKSAGTDSRKMFSIVNDLLGKRCETLVLPDMSSEKAAETLGNFFTDKVEKIRKSFGERDSLPLVDNAFAGTPLEELAPICEEGLKRIILSSKPTYSTVDPIPTKIVLACMDILLPVLVRIINSCLLSAKIPRPLKTAIIKPLLKKNGLDTNDCNNYRPVSNLSFVSKILERVVSQQLVQHLNANNLLDPFQSAYRHGHSCETALLRVLNDVLCSADRGELSLLVLLDLSAAFDVIDHELLLARLQKEMGITGNALQWFTSYLEDRTQCVVVKQASSQSTPLSCGVPQGSVLGPILFSIYTSKLGKIINTHGVNRKLFADDTELYISFNPDPASCAVAVKSLEDCCLSVKSWMVENRLKLNDDKTVAILCGSHAKIKTIKLEVIKVGTAEITLSDCVKDLGLFIDSKLSMTAHISSVVRACSMQLRAFGQLRPHLNKETANAVAVSLVLSRLDYCNSCLWGIPKKQIERLQKVQNNAARIVSLVERSAHITPILQDLHWLPVQKRIEYKLLSLTFSCLDGTAPCYLQNLLTKYVPSRGLRSAEQSLLKPPSVFGHKKKTFGVRAFESVAPVLWNNLPHPLKQIESKSFKKNLKTYLFK